MSGLSNSKVLSRCRFGYSLQRRSLALVYGSARMQTGFDTCYCLFHHRPHLLYQIIDDWKHARRFSAVKIEHGILWKGDLDPWAL